jgi:hypothetical protein
MVQVANQVIDDRVRQAAERRQARDVRLARRKAEPQRHWTFALARFRVSRRHA